MRDKNKQLCLLFKEKQYDKLLQTISETEQNRFLTADELVMKGIALQHSSAADQKHLKYSEEAFKEALNIVPEHVGALMELGWLYLMVRDDPEQARQLFEKAFEVCRKQMTEAVLGIAKCMHEKDGKALTLRFLDEVISKTLNREDLAKFLEEIIGYV